MSFVQGKCENCGGILAVDSSLKAANCPFCGAAYVVQDSINYYNTTIKVDTMHADVVNVSDESSAEGRLKAADAFMKLGKYENAEGEYKRVTELTPQDYRGWLGLIESHTCKYTKRTRLKSERKVLDDYAKSVLVFAPQNMGETLLKEYKTYIDSEKEKNENEISIIEDSILKQKEQLKQLDAQQNEFLAEMEKNDARINSIKKTIKFWDGFVLCQKGIEGIVILGGVFLGLAVMALYFSGGKLGYISLVIGLAFFGILIWAKIRNVKLNKQLKVVSDNQLNLIAQEEKLMKQKDAIDSVIRSNQMDIAKF